MTRPLPFVIVLVTVVPCVLDACGRAPAPVVPPDAPSTRARDIDPADTIAFPMQPAGCTYRVEALSPGHPSAAPNGPRRGRAPVPANVHLTYVGDPSNSVVVQWTTDSDTLASEVLVGRGDTAPNVPVRGYSFTYGGGGRRREHEVHVCGLTPATRYTYEVSGAGVRVGPYAFTTAPDAPGPVRVLVVGDARTDPAMWGRVAARALTERPDVMLFTGDAVVDGASQARWDDFFHAAPELLATTPGLWTDGNHEGVSEVYYAQFAFPANGTARHHERWYATTYGPMRVLVLNDTTAPKADVVGIEREFLDRSLSAVDRARTPWVITMHHQPMWSTAVGHWPDEETRAAWGPLFDRYHVDVDLSGHVHNYQSTLALRDGVITDDARGTRYLVFGGAGAPLYPFRANTAWIRKRESVHGYAMMTVDAHTLRWDAHRVDGSLIESFTIAQGGS